MNMQLNESRYEDELLKKLDEIGFTEISSDAFLKQFPEFKDKIRRPIQNVWGLKMRADKWADTWVMKVNDDYAPYITYIDGNKRMWSGAFFVLGFLKKISESLKEQLVEKLSKKQPASEWIHDFVYSKNPMFKDKSKKERIKMALGAYYAAQKNEDVDYSTLFKANDDSIDYDPEQLAAGIKIEMEHTDDEEIATIIAKHHLAEDPEYYIKLVSCVEKGSSSQADSKIKEAVEKIACLECDEVSTKDAWKKNHGFCPVCKTSTQGVAESKVEEEYGAGFEGTDELRKKYIKDTPGQKIQHFKTNMKEDQKEYSVTYLTSGGQGTQGVKRTYRTKKTFISREKMEKWIDDAENGKIEGFIDIIAMTEAYGESWVVYNKDTKAKISKSFKTRKAAYDYASKNGGVVYSAEYYFDNQDEINSGKLVKEESLDEAQNLVSKGIYTFDGKKIDGARSSKLFLQALDSDGFLHNLSWKEWSESDLEDTSADSTKKQFVDRLAKQIKMFNKRIDLNTWLKGGDRSFTDTVNYIFKLDPNIKYAKASGLKEESLDEAINIRDYMVTSEKSQFGGYTPKVVHKNGKTMYSGQAAYNTPDEAKDHAEEYLKQYARGISEPRVPIKGTYVKEASKNGLNENEDKYPTWIIKPRDGGEPVKIKAQDETSAIEIALGRKPSQHELDFFNFHYICICEQIELPTLRNMKIVELATNCNDESLVKEFVEQQYKPNSSVLEIKESFKSFISNK